MMRTGSVAVGTVVTVAPSPGSGVLQKTITRELFRPPRPLDYLSVMAEGRREEKLLDRGTFAFICNSLLASETFKLHISFKETDVFCIPFLCVLFFFFQTVFHTDTLQLYF